MYTTVAFHLNILLISLSLFLFSLLRFTVKPSHQQPSNTTTSHNPLKICSSYYKTQSTDQLENQNQAHHRPPSTVNQHTTTQRRRTQRRFEEEPNERSEEEEEPTEIRRRTH